MKDSKGLFETTLGHSNRTTYHLQPTRFFKRNVFFYLVPKTLITKLNLKEGTHEPDGRYPMSRSVASLLSKEGSARLAEIEDALACCVNVISAERPQPAAPPSSESLGNNEYCPSV